ncbi:hypothetical protein EMGBS4_02780 [Acidimicrobiaceae bacterium]|nr:hypothetical protein EMGBS4_02780 [Acidimicrobiaceae bacterium]
MRIGILGGTGPAGVHSGCAWLRLAVTYSLALEMRNEQLVSVPILLVSGLTLN